MIGDKERFHEEICGMAAEAEEQGPEYTELDDTPMILRPRTPFDDGPLFGSTPDLPSMPDRK